MNMAELSAVQGRAWDDVDVSDTVTFGTEPLSKRLTRNLHKH